MDIDSCQDVLCFHLFLLGVEAENACKTYMHPHVLSLPADSDAHLLVPSCVLNQTPPRPQLIQCDNDPYRLAPGIMVHGFSYLLVGQTAHRNNTVHNPMFDERGRLWY